MTEDARSSIQLTGGVGTHVWEHAAIPGPETPWPNALQVTEYRGHTFERVWTILEPEKDWLLLNLLKECWPTVCGKDGFHEWLNAHDIAHDDWGWASYD
jgi:hypothetical protein